MGSLAVYRVFKRPYSGHSGTRDNGYGSRVKSLLHVAGIDAVYLIVLQVWQHQPAALTIFLRRFKADDELTGKLIPNGG